MSSKKTSSRLLALDLARGFFIVVIIIDHLYRWPSALQYITGRGELWSSAAEGFVIISGLLVGYVRGYKNRKLPLWEVTQKLLRRGLLLYMWVVITTIVITLVSWYIPVRSSVAFIPYATGDIGSLISGSLQLNYVHTLTHFLYLYAIFLIFAPIAIWLLRTSRAWAVAIVSLIVWGIGFTHNIEWMEWQIIFFIPAIAGFYLDSILDTFWRLEKSSQYLITISFITATVITAVFSASIALPMDPGSYKFPHLDRDSFNLYRAGISFIWFIGVVGIFGYGLPWIKKYLGWLLLPFGERSLTAYILHAVPLMLCTIIFGPRLSYLENTILGIACVLLTWMLVKIPKINSVIPR